MNVLKLLARFCESRLERQLVAATRDLRAEAEQQEKRLRGDVTHLHLGLIALCERIEALEGRASVPTLAARIEKLERRRRRPTKRR